MLLEKKAPQINFTFNPSSANQWFICNDGRVIGMAFAVSVKDSCYYNNGHVINSHQVEGWVYEAEMQSCDQFWVAALDCGMHLPHCYQLSNLRDAVRDFYRVGGLDEF